jgi:hypothetical protein
VLAFVLFSPARSYSQSEGALSNEDGVASELLSLGKKGEAIARARGQVLRILQQDNSCTAWFQEVDPDASEVFRSLHFEVEENGTSIVYGLRDQDHGLRFKHPWGARTIQYAGRNATIILNSNGAFFRRSSPILKPDLWGRTARPAGNLTLVISSYPGNTAKAQIAILLHELGHIIGRLPEDDDSWDGRSSQNTAEVVRHCKAETKAAAHNNLRASN